MSTKTIFLSASTLDLKRWRNVLHTAFSRAGFRVLTQDQSLGSSLRDVRDLLEKAIDESDCVIHLAGMAYGSDALNPFASEPSFQCSWSQFEYYLAHQKKKDVIAFVCAPNLSSVFREKGETHEVELKKQLQMAHRERIALGTFQNTPLEACSRTLNEEVSSQSKLLEAVAAAVGSLHKKGPEFALAEQEVSKAKDQMLRQSKRILISVLIIALIGAILVTKLWNSPALIQKDVSEISDIIRNKPNVEMRSHWNSKSKVITGLTDRMVKPSRLTLDYASKAAMSWVKEVDLTAEAVSSLKVNLDTISKALGGDEVVAAVSSVESQLSSLRALSNSLTELGSDWDTYRKNDYYDGSLLSKFEARRNICKERARGIFKEYATSAGDLELRMQFLLGGKPLNKSDLENLRQIRFNALDLDYTVSALSRSGLVARRLKETVESEEKSAEMAAENGDWAQSLSIRQKIAANVQGTLAENARNYCLRVAPLYHALSWNYPHDSIREGWEKDLAEATSMLGTHIETDIIRSWNPRGWRTAKFNHLQNVVAPDVLQLWGKECYNTLLAAYNLCHLRELLRPEGSNMEKLSSKEEIVKIANSIHDHSLEAKMPDEFIQLSKNLKELVSLMNYQDDYEIEKSTFKIVTAKTIVPMLEIAGELSMKL